MAALDGRETLRRVVIAVAVVLGLGGLAVAGAAVREVDAEGDVIEQTDDPNDVAISGEQDLIDQQPPGAAGGGPSTAEIVERTIPAEGAEILQQQQIGIEVGSLYRVSTLTIDRTPIAEDNLIRRDELNQVFFQPGEGLEFEAFPAGRVCAVAEVEQVTTGEPVRSVEWCFEVT
jgi:hypothetical protein